MTIRILHGDCREVLKTLPDNSVDSIVTDPPYELGFMGKGWDKSGVANDVETWRQALRVLKPGGHLLAFSGTRTYHRMVCAIEDAGFEIRDQLQWVYASGFPKSYNLDNLRGKETCGCEDRQADAAEGDAIAAPQPQARGAWPVCGGCGLPVLPRGLGTALKPANEPIVLARKPLVGTVAANVLEHGTGALNIDGCRVAYTGTEDAAAAAAAAAAEIRSRQTGRNVEGWGMQAQSLEREAYLAGPAGLGRWPANLLHDGCQEVVALFPQSNGQQAAVGPEHGAKNAVNAYGDFGPRETFNPRGDSGSAARFFWCPKASRRDRNEGLEGLEGRVTDDGRQVPADNAYQRGKTLRQNHHPTVKPTDLMRYLCRLVTPPGGTVLDPFMGSGSTLKAAELEGFSAIGIELDPDYIDIARRRIAADAPLFAECAI